MEHPWAVGMMDIPILLQFRQHFRGDPINGKLAGYRFDRPGLLHGFTATKK